MKVFKGISYLLLIVIMLIAPIMGGNYIDDVDANRPQTLRDLKNNLAEWERRAAANLQQQRATEAEIRAARESIARAGTEIIQIEEEIVELNAEIDQLTEDIKLMNVQLREIMVYYQLTSTGENAYLEYIFTATDFTDFIYRMAIAEQLSDHNARLIDEYEALIIKTEELRRAREGRVVELQNRRVALERQIVNLQGVLAETITGATDIRDEIAAVRQHVRYYEVNLRCGLDELLTACETRNIGQLPADTAFWRPVISGRVSSEYGPRSFILNGRPTSDFHHGIDFAAPRLTPIYSSAAGRVVAIINAEHTWRTTGRTTCGGNMVFVIHNINGNRFTTAYMHLATINTSVGATVSRDTMVGTMGGTSNERWDPCSTGSHLHFQIATGHYLTDYSGFSGFTARSFNPRNVVNAPARGVPFNNRTQRF